MPLPIPNLDDRTFEDLVSELRDLIPRHCEEWTNHNVSDPGITLIELFAWLAEQVIYRLNHVSRETYEKFLKLVGIDPDSEESLDSAIARALESIGQTDRAITSQDFEYLAVQASDKVKRAHCVPNMNLASGDVRQEGAVSVILVTEESLPDEEKEALRETVFDYVDSRRLLTTRLCVVEPTYPSIGIEVAVIGSADLTEGTVVEKIKGFLHPLKGGPEGKGWQLGRTLYVSELYELIEGISGVKVVERLVLGRDEDLSAIRIGSYSLIGSQSATITVTVRHPQGQY